MFPFRQLRLRLREYRAQLLIRLKRYASQVTR